MKYLLLVSILLLLFAGTLMALTGSDEPDSFFITSELRQQPAVPLNLSITKSGDTITLDWDAVTEDVDGNALTDISYKVYCGDIPDFECNDDDNLIETVTVPTLVLDNATGTMDRAFFKVIAVGAETDPPIPVNFVYVPAGTFTMGDTRGGGLSDELPTHSVSLNSFYMDMYPVTQAEYVAIIGSNPATGPGVGDDYPVYLANWYSAIKYCNLRSMAEELSPCYTISGYTDPANWGEIPDFYNDVWDAVICNWNANGYRLPTEAEWEYAARGASNNPDYLYSGSDIIDAVAWYDGNNSPWGSPLYGSKPVGTKAANALDIYDMSGNIWEWCWDWYSSSYYSSSPDSNPTGLASGGDYRVLRGGSWSDDAYYCRIAVRNNSSPYGISVSSGFRLCRSGL